MKICKVNKDVSRLGLGKLIWDDSKLDNSLGNEMIERY